MAKLVFAGIILGGLMRQDIPPILLFVIGGSAMAIIMGVGLFLAWEDKQDKND